MEMAKPRQLLPVWAIRNKRPYDSISRDKRRQFRIKTLSELQKQMKQMDTKYKLETTLAFGISEWFKTGHVSLKKYSEKFHDAIWSQGATSWR